jgi:sulfatase maturation enzyme AslB (radical SAM superfamily)
MEITTQIGCKNNCVYCPQDKLIKQYIKRSKIFQMSFDVFKTCLNKIPTNVDIYFSGMCEPWLNSECTKMLMLAQKRNHGIRVYTTLVGMRPSDIDLLATVPFKMFVVHLPSEGNYERIIVDESYLATLDKLCKCTINALYVFSGEKLHPKVSILMNNNLKNIYQLYLITRANNIKIKNRPFVKRRKGKLKCLMNLRSNVLLPNGDVILCCMDYGMKHVLGNLLSSDYDSLFYSDEFLKIKIGLQDESKDILCRYCEHESERLYKQR